MYVALYFIFCIIIVIDKFQHQQAIDFALMEYLSKKSDFTYISENKFCDFTHILKNKFCDFKKKLYLCSDF